MPAFRDSLGLHLELSNVAADIKKVASAYQKMSTTVTRENSKIARSTRAAFGGQMTSGQFARSIRRSTGDGVPVAYARAGADMANLQREIDSLGRKAVAGGGLPARSMMVLKAKLTESATATKRLTAEFVKLDSITQKRLMPSFGALRDDMADTAKFSAKVVAQTTLMGRLMSRFRGMFGRGGSGGGGGGPGSGGGGGPGSGGGGGPRRGRRYNGYNDMSGYSLGGLLLDRLPAAIGRIGSGANTLTGGNVSGTIGLMDNVDELNRTLHRTRSELAGVRRELVMAGNQFGAVLNPTRISEATQAVVQSGFRSINDIKTNMQLVGLGAAATGAGAGTVAQFTRMLQMGGMSQGGAASMTAMTSRLAERGGSSAGELMQTSAMAQQGMGASLVFQKPQDQQRTLSSLSTLQSALTAQGVSSPAAQELVRRISAAVSNPGSPEAVQFANLTGLTGGSRGSLMAVLRAGKGAEIIKRIQNHGARMGSPENMNIAAGMMGIDPQSFALVTKNGDAMVGIYDDMAKSIEKTGDAMKYLNEQGKKAQTTATSAANTATMAVLAHHGMDVAGAGHEINIGNAVGGIGNIAAGIGQTGLTLMALRGALGGGGAGAGGGAARLLSLGRFGAVGLAAGAVGYAGYKITDAIRERRKDNLLTASLGYGSRFSPEALARGDLGFADVAGDQASFAQSRYSHFHRGSNPFNGLDNVYSGPMSRAKIRAQSNQARLHQVMLQMYQAGHPGADPSSVNFADVDLMNTANQAITNADYAAGGAGKGKVDISPYTDEKSPEIDKQDMTNLLLKQILMKLGTNPIAQVNAS